MYWKPNVFNLIRGNDDSLLIFLMETDTAGNMIPIPIAGCSAISFKFKNKDGTVLEKTPGTGISVGVCNPVTAYGVDFTAAEIANLQDGFTTVEVKMMFGSKVHLYDIKKCVNVTDPSF